jgi:hypothetical protein
MMSSLVSLIAVTSTFACALWFWRRRAQKQQIVTRLRTRMISCIFPKSWEKNAQYEYTLDRFLTSTTTLSNEEGTGGEEDVTEGVMRVLTAPNSSTCMEWFGWLTDLRNFGCYRTSLDVAATARDAIPRAQFKRALSVQLLPLLDVNACDQVERWIGGTMHESYDLRYDGTHVCFLELHHDGHIEEGWMMAAIALQFDKGTLSRCGIGQACVNNHFAC